MEILNYEGLLKYNEALHEDLLTNYASVLDINAVELDIEALKTDKVNVSDMQVDVIDANGHEYVDLGLPSGTLWATMNVGASSETDYGNYYQYGKGAAQYAATSGDSNYGGTEDPLDSSVDTAVQVWGGSWHMPTRAQMEELTANTTYEWTTINGVNGGKFTATNGNYVFFPATGYWYNGSQYDVGNGGYYWGSSPDGSNDAYYLFFSNGDEGVGNDYRESGDSVRPVLNASKGPKYATKAELANVATSGSYNDLSDKPTIPTVQIITNQEIALLFDPYRGHEYVEIAGIKWATMNIGASQPSDYGLYFQWGDTQGYTAAQVGSGEGQKYFGWADYKYGNGTSSPDVTGMTKYNATDGLTTLEAIDDAAVANWGGSWRMPTTAEFQALGAAVNTAWTADYQGSGIAGLVCTDKTDSSKTLFFPAADDCDNGSVEDVGNGGYFWSSSLYTNDRQYAYILNFNSDNASWDSLNDRYYGCAVRAVVD